MPLERKRKTIVTNSKTMPLEAFMAQLNKGAELEKTIVPANKMEIKPGYTISTDKSLLQPEAIHGFLSKSYWANGRTMETVLMSIEHSLCYGVYCENKQVGFARVITDYVTFAYLADVYILEEHRGKGLSKQLIATIVAHPQLQGLRRFVLATRDAHILYEKYGFKALSKPERWMEIFKE